MYTVSLPFVPGPASTSGYRLCGCGAAGGSDHDRSRIAHLFEQDGTRLDEPPQPCRCASGDVLRVGKRAAHGGSVRYTFGRIAGKRATGARGWSYRLRMSPPRDIDPASPTSRDVWLSLTFERSPAADLMARLTVDEPEGRLVDVELDGNELARLLAGETVTVAATIGAERGEALPATPDVVEAEAIPEDAGEPAIEVPASVASSDYGTSVDDPPAGTEPIARSTDVAPGEAVVAYIRGRWRDAVVARRDIGSLLVTYSPPQGSFGDVQLRIATKWVRRLR